MSGYITFFPQDKTLIQMLFAYLCKSFMLRHYICVTPVCRYLLWIASPDLFSSQAVGFARGEFGLKAHCHRLCHKSIRLLHI